MSTIEAIVAVTPGSPAIINRPYPSLPADDYILVRPTAWSINPADAYYSNLEGQDDTQLGSDFAGVVLKVGEGVTKGLKVGDRVSGALNGGNRIRKTDGAYADVIHAKGNIVARIPETVSDVEAATQGIAIGTVGQSLYQQLQLPLPTSPAKTSITLFIYGGSTAMGIAGLQFAKASGVRVITTSSPHNAEYLYSLGADYVLDYSSPTVVDEVRDIMKGEPLRLAWDCRPTDKGARISAEVLSREGSRYVTLLPHTQALVKEINPTVETFFTAAYTVFGEPWFFLGYHDAVPEDHEFMKSFVLIAEDLLREGKVKAPRVFLNRGGKGLPGVLKGIEEMTAGNVSGGKLVYTRE